ncbi:MAG: hypothetical protein RLZZ230_524 [Candidatus Parcubacteria bacterium]|jgi:plastocyanin domain-containing protein
MQKNIALSILAVSVIVTGMIFLSGNKSDSSTNKATVAEVNNVEIRDGIQYVTITAKGGYTPKNSVIQPNLPTKLIVKTTGTFDCSSSLVIRSLNFQKMLQPNGEETIDIGTLAAGEKLQGTCSMGMYNFKIETS